MKVCVGTACHVKGSLLVYDAFIRNLDISKNSVTDKTGTYTMEKVSCLGCCTLAPVVQIDGITYGHVSSNQVDEVLFDFSHRKEETAVKVYKKGWTNEPLGEIRIGLGSCCVASGSEEVQKAIEKTVGSGNLNVKVKHVGCVGMCHQVPLVEVVPVNRESSLYAKVKPEEVKNIIEKHFQPEGFFQKLSRKITNKLEALQSDFGQENIETYSIDIRENMYMLFSGTKYPLPLSSGE
ncbi:MAG: hypothetical protein HC906_18300 [Bacteroidales bacterium]|nr:hypothetical protein [Bacteroidales bacterium]